MVHCPVVTVVPEKGKIAQSGGPPQILYGGGWFHAERERCRIRSDDQVLFLPAPQRQRRHTERTVLIDVVPVERAEGGFRDAPRHTVLLGIGNLAAHRIITGSIEQRILVCLSE